LRDRQRVFFSVQSRLAPRAPAGQRRPWRPPPPASGLTREARGGGR